MENGLHALPSALDDASVLVQVDDDAVAADLVRAVVEHRALAEHEGAVRLVEDGANEVGGDRVIVYLDEDRSVVEGGRKRVKAILHPDREEKADGMDQAQKKADARQTAVEAAR